jgi:hypothetical protein
MPTKLEVVPTKREVANYYRAGANYLEKNPHKWCQHSLLNHRGQCCAVGAMGRAVNRNAYATPHRSKIAEKKVLGAILTSFNDTSISPKGVIRAMRRVARALEHGAPL